MFVCSFLKNNQIYGLMLSHILVTVEKVQRFPNSLCTPEALQGTCPLMLAFSWFLHEGEGLDGRKEWLEFYRMCAAFAYRIVDSKLCLYRKNRARRIEIGSHLSRMKECWHFQRSMELWAGGMAHKHNLFFFHHLPYPHSSNDAYKTGTADSLSRSLLQQVFYWQC